MRSLYPTLFAATLAAAGPALAASPADVGSWGEAWGDDSVSPAPAPPRTTLPAPAPPTAMPAPTGATVAGRSPAPGDLGSWEDVWKGSAPAAAPTVATSPIPAAPVGPVSVAAGPRSADIAGWGAAWREESAPSPPARPVTAAVAGGPALAAAPAPAPAASAAPTAGAGAGPRLAAGTPVPVSEGEEPVQLTADQITHDRELGIVTAKGRVEIVQANQTLVADAVSYNLKQDVMAASGNVIITQPKGEVLFADYFELTGDFKDGVASQIKVILADASRLGADSAQRVGGNRLDFDHAVYTACEPCRRHPERRPLWEAKAERITHNQAEHQIEYRDAWIELAGIPVLYTPYLSHPDPTVRHKSGFLAPVVGMSSTLGANVTIPYFWAIGDNQDMTFAPRFLFPSSSSSDAPDLDREGRSLLQRVVLAGEHRWRGMQGETRSSASLTADKYSADLRGHIDATGQFDLDRTWRAGYQVQRTSDDTYSAIYRYSFERNQPWLTTRPYLEGFGRRNYTMVEAYSFQGLSSDDDPGESPLVFPHLTFSHVGAPSSRGGYWTMDSDALSYARSEGTAANRLSSTLAWHRPFLGSRGDITELTASMRGDAYHADHLEDGGGSANAGRALPQVALNWRQPFIRPHASLPQVIEPLVMLAVSPNGGNSPKIPNEDSINFELDEINVLQADRMTGLDRVEGGLRGGYGLRWSMYPRQGGYLTAQVGQGWRARRDSTFAEGEGFDNNLSDYVGRLDIAPSQNFMLLNRVRLDQETLSLRRNENTLTIGSAPLRFSVTYLMLEKAGQGDQFFDRRHAIIYGVSSALSRYWSASVQLNESLLDGGDLTDFTSRLAYSDECFAFVSKVQRSFTNDRDDLSGYEITFNIVLKTLGDIPLNVF